MVKNDENIPKMVKKVFRLNKNFNIFFYLTSEKLNGKVLWSLIAQSNELEATNINETRHRSVHRAQGHSFLKRGHTETFEQD